MLRRRFLPLILLAFLFATTTTVHGQANCALRHPDRQIFEIFPDASGYKTLEARIDPNNRPAIEAELGSALSQTDTGTHTVYVVLQGEVPIGIVHARTENGTRGSVELVWAMDLNLAIRDFRVQRSREPNTDLVKSESFRQHMVGRDLGELRELLARGNDEVNYSALGVPAIGESIAHTVVVCALKTRVITDVAFRELLTPARMLGAVHRAFPGTESIGRISTPLEGAAGALVAGILGGDLHEVDRGTLTVLRALGPEKRPLGALVFARWSSQTARPETWWAVGPDGAVKEVTIVGAVKADMRAALAGLAGRRLADLPAPGATEHAHLRVAREVLAVLAANGVGG